MKKRTAQERRQSKFKTEPRAAKLSAINEYKQARTRKQHLFKKEKGQLNDQALSDTVVL
jgi:hypothetical protein